MRVLLKAVVVVLLLLVAGFACLRMEQRNRIIETNEWRVLCTLRKILEAAVRYQKGVEKDKDKNGVGEYPTEFTASMEITVMDSTGKWFDFSKTQGEGVGYRFRIAAGSITPEYSFYATAVPIGPGRSGVRSFCTALDGIFYASPSGSPPPVDYFLSDGGEGKPGGDFVVCEQYRGVE